MIILKIFKNDSIIPVVQNINEFPCTMGRSIKNNVILDDPSISSDHAIINFDEQGYYLQDLKSTNGIIEDGNRTETVRLNEDKTIQIGTLKIAFILGEERLEKTRVIQIPSSIMFSGQKRLMLQSGFYFLILCLLSFFYEYLLNPIDKINFLNILWTIISGFFLLTVIVSAFSIFSKIHLKKYRPFTFFSFFTLWSCCFVVIYDFLPYIAFYLNHPLLYSIIFYTISYTFLLYSGWQLACISFPQTTSKKIAIIFCAGFILIQSLILITDVLKENNNFSYQGSLSYPIIHYSKSHYPTKTLFTQIKTSLDEIDEFRTKEINKRSKEKNP